MSELKRMMAVLACAVAVAQMGYGTAGALGQTPCTMSAATTEPCATKETATTCPAETACASKPADDGGPLPLLKTKKDFKSYALGVQTARTLKTQKMDVDPALLARGIYDGMNDSNFLMSEELIKQAMDVVTNEARARMAANRQVLPLLNKKEGKEFLAANATKQGVVSLPSGLQYKVIKDGNGPKPTDDDTVVCVYSGQLTDGTVFDSTDMSHHPAVIKVNDVIPGWREALKLMPVGSRWQLFVPGDLAYSGKGYGSLVGPNATLIYELELMGIEKKDGQ